MFSIVVWTETKKVAILRLIHVSFRLWKTADRTVNKKFLCRGMYISKTKSER